VIPVKPAAILYDLDDTLLVNSMDTFVPAYLGALTEFMSELVMPSLLTHALLDALRVLDEDADVSRSNAEVFFDAFLPPLGRDRADLEARFERFYEEVFPSLQPLTRPDAASHDAVHWARNDGRSVVVATNPIFPATAIEQRIRWARLDPAWFDLITCLERSRATKAQPEYYREIAHRLEIDPRRCVMVGDNWTWDVANSSRIGMSAWWIAAPDAPRPDRGIPILGQGPLADFVAFAEANL
jgi:FMN phosphatase YigB (HAD superfamily)